MSPADAGASGAAPAGTQPVGAGTGHQVDGRGQLPAPADHRWLVLAIVAVAQLMVVLDSTIVNIALPSAQRDLGFGLESRQWIITAYALAFGSLLLLGGRLSDLLGRRVTLLTGLLGFATASAVGGAAANFGLLVGARTLQGVFAAVLAPAALSTLNVTFADAKERARAFGIFAGVAVGGSVIGLIVGGMLTEWLSWRWCLYVNLFFAVPAAVGVLAYVRAETAHRSTRIDIPGVLTVSSGLFCLVYALSNAARHGWGSPATIAFLAAAGLLLAAFVAIEVRVAGPLLPMRVLTDRNRAASYLAIALSSCSMFGAFLFLTYYLQQDLGYSPLRTGAAFLPLSASIIVFSNIANTRLVPRFGPRPLVPTGMLVAAVGMVWLAQLSTASTYAGNVLGPMIILGSGMGMTFAPSLATATAGVERRDVGVGSAMVSTSQQVGGAVGTAALSTIFASSLSRYAASHRPGPGLPTAASIHGYTVAFSVSAGIFLTGMVLTALLFRSRSVEPAGRVPEPAR